MLWEEEGGVAPLAVTRGSAADPDSLPDGDEFDIDVTSESGGLVDGSPWKLNVKS